MATALMCLALGARAQQLYTVHYHTRALPPAGSARRPNDAVVAGRLLRTPLSVQFRGTAKWSPFLTLPPPSQGALRPGQTHTTDLFITQALGPLASVVVRAGGADGAHYNASAPGAWAPIDRLNVEVGDAHLMKFAAYVPQDTGEWIFANARAHTRGFDAQDKLIQDISLAAAASSVALLFLCSLCAQARSALDASKRRSGGGGDARVGVSSVPGYGDGFSGESVGLAGYGVASPRGGSGYGGSGTTLPAMQSMGDGAYDVGGSAGGRGFTGAAPPATSSTGSTLLAPIRVGAAPAAPSAASAPDSGFSVPQNRVQAASAAAASTGYDGSAVGGGYGGGIGSVGAGAQPAYGGYNAAPYNAAPAPLPAAGSYGGGSGAMDYTQPQNSGGFDTFDEEEPL